MTGGSSLFYLAVVVCLVIAISLSVLPILNAKGPFELSENRTKIDFFNNSWTTDLGHTVVLPPKYANTIRNDDRVSFTALLATNGM